MSSHKFRVDASRRVDRTKLIVIILILVSFLILIPVGFSQENPEETNGWILASVPDSVN